MRPLELVHNEDFDLLLVTDQEPRELRPAEPDLNDAAAVQAWWAERETRQQARLALQQAHVAVVLHGILMNEVDYVQFTGRRDEQGVRIRVYFWQTCYLLDDKVIAFCGRDVGKTSAVKWKLEHRITNFPTGSCLLSGHQDDRVAKVWKETVMTEMRQHWWARHFFSDAHGSGNSRNPYHQFFNNGFRLYGRPASEHTAYKVESPHCHAVVIDEMQEYSWPAWEKLQPAINDFTPNIVHGAFHFFCGVNSGGRQDNVFYELAFRSKIYSAHRYIIASWMNPKYSVDTHQKYLESYDYSVDASRFKQMIRGMTGDRNKGLIQPLDYSFSVVQARESFQLTDRHLFPIDKSTWAAHGADAAAMFRRMGLSRWPRQAELSDMVGLAMDYGSTSPSEIGIFYRVLNPRTDATARNRHLWLLWNRITLLGIPGNEQAFIVDFLDSFLAREGQQWLDFLSVDSTASTDVVSQLLLDAHNPNYREKEYQRRLYPARSNGDIAVKYQLEEPENAALAPAGFKWRKQELLASDGYRLPVWALLCHANVLSSQRVGQLFQDRVFAISGADSELQGELTTIVEKIMPGKLPTYEAHGGYSGQHRFSMFRSFAQWHHRRFVLQEAENALLGQDETAWYGSQGGGEAFATVGGIELPELQRQEDFFDDIA
jgi:hypothetical protein